MKQVVNEATQYKSGWWISGDNKIGSIRIIYEGLKDGVWDVYGYALSVTSDKEGKERIKEELCRMWSESSHGYYYKRGKENFILDDIRNITDEDFEKFKENNHV